MLGFDYLDQDEDTDVQQGFDVQIYVVEYKDYMKDCLDKLTEIFETQEHLDKKICKTFLSMLDEGYDKINALTEMMEYEVVEDPESITTQMDKENNRLYLLMDQKFRDELCSEEGYRLLNRKNYLEWVDVYYNLFCLTHHREYLFTALEYGDLDALFQIDLFMQKNGKNNKNPRYFTYLEILSKKYKNFRNFFKFKISD
jgi:hypothetical protein